ncbi:hypothetical protein [Flagellimonas sp. 2504JD1-5]
MKKAIFFLATLLVFVGCSSDDEIENPELNQTWVLNNVICFCFFGDDFDFSTHKITFNSSEKTVTIENSVDNPFIAPAGTYSYSDNGEVIEIEGKQYTYDFKENSLNLHFVDEPLIADDEITYYYLKN